MKLFESYLPLEPNTPPYRYHQIAWKGFPSVLSGDAPFQVNMDRGEGRLRVRSVERPGWPAYFNVEVREIEVPEGRVTFKVLLDPVLRVRGKSKVLRDPSEVFAWAKGKFEESGLDIQEMSFRPVVDLPPVTDRKGNPVPTSAWEFQVEADVLDAEAWSGVVRDGLGRKKRFGFGMVRFRG